MARNSMKFVKDTDLQNANRKMKKQIRTIGYNLRIIMQKRAIWKKKRIKIHKFA